MRNDIEWLEPWENLCTAPSSFEKELYAEVGEQHVLYNKKVVAIGRRYDCDSFLFLIDDSGFSIAVVHLTYSQRKEKDPNYPKTELYKDLNDWSIRCMLPNHSEYMLSELD